MKKTLLPVAALLALLLAGTLLRSWLIGGDAALPATELSVPDSCTLVQQPCRLPSGYQVRVLGDMKVLEPFIVELAGPGISGAEMDFQMPGMNMGINRFRFARVRQDLWQVRVIIPVCASARLDWIATIDFVSDAEKSIRKRIVLPLLMNR
jgi:hypothetical protein